MSDTVIVGITGEYRWTRRPVWFWQTAGYQKRGWRKDRGTSPLRPTMIFKERRPNGAAPFAPSEEKTSAK